MSLLYLFPIVMIAFNIHEYLATLLVGFSLCFYWLIFKKILYPLLGICIFYYVFTFYQHSLLLPIHEHNQDVQFIGWVTKAQEMSKKVHKIEVSVEQISVNSLDYLKKLSLMYYTKKSLDAGDPLICKIRLKSIQNKYNPNYIDYEKNAIRQGLQAKGYIKSERGRLECLPIEKMTQKPWSIFWLDFKKAIHEKVRSRIHGDSRFLSALLLGSVELIQGEEWEILERTGSIHMFIISGLHLGIIFYVFFYLFKYPLGVLLWYASWAQRKSSSEYATFFAWLATAFYVAICDGGLSIIRAFIMISLLSIAIIFRLKKRIEFVFFMTLSLVLLLDPYAPQGSGFWFSFLAVFALSFYFIQRVGLKQYAFWVQFLIAQWVVYIGVFPFLWYESNLWIPFSMLSNLLVLPIITYLVMPLGLLGVITIVLFNRDFFLLNISNFFLEQVLLILEKFSEYFLFFYAPAIPAWFACILTLIIFFCFSLGFQKSYILIFATILLMGVLLVKESSFDKGEFSMWVFDVGQGLSVLISTQNHHLIYDTGIGFSGGFNMGDSVVIPALKKMGISKIDRILVSHSDNDHMGGLAGLMDRYPQASVMMNGLNKDYPYDEICVAGKAWIWDEVSFKILSPLKAPKAKKEESNNDSCVLLVENNKFSFLMTGDIENSQERLLLEKYELQAVNKMLSPHHGSKTSSSYAFLNAMSLEDVIVSSGYQNRYRHPHQKVVDRYRNFNIKIHRTDQKSAIYWDSSRNQFKYGIELWKPWWKQYMSEYSMY